MSTINPVQAPVEQAPAFKAKGKYAKKIADGFMKNAKKLPPDVAFMEQNAGMCYAASVKNPAVLKETVCRVFCEPFLFFMYNRMDKP